MSRILVKFSSKSFSRFVSHLLGISNTLFIGSFAQQLSLSRTFARDLLLGIPPSSHTMLQDWQSRLASIQARSLHLWQEDAVRRAISALRRGSDKSVLSRNSSIVPNEPSTFLLQSLTSLLRSLHDLPLHRLYSSPSPAAALLESFSTGALEVAGEFFELLRNLEGGEETKRRLLWDVTLIGLIVGKGEQKSWEQTTTKLAQLVSSTLTLSNWRETNLTSQLSSYHLRARRHEKRSLNLQQPTSFELNRSTRLSSRRLLLFLSHHPSISNYLVHQRAFSHSAHLHQPLRENSKLYSESFNQVLVLAFCQQKARKAVDCHEDFHLTLRASVPIDYARETE